jgi:hypothetical protein
MKKIITIIVLVVILFSCKENQPTELDGNNEIQIVALWKNYSLDSLQSYAPLVNSEVVFVSEYGTLTETTDENGILILKDIPSAIYQISVRGLHPDDNNIQIVGNITDVEVKSGNTLIDTIITKPISASGISINEIYSGGPVNSFFFCFDQFIELYNSSDKVKYLDGIQVFRFSGTDGGTKGPGSDWGLDGDVDGITYAFKFPGKAGEQNYPFKPNSFLVLASDAYDHRNTVSTSIDLSNADWEFVNQFNAVDIDNPNVPNLETFQLDDTHDFLLRTYNDIVIIASGADTVWQDGIDFETVLDGVEYQKSINFIVTLDDRIDRGWILNPPIYSGESMQRRDKGVDTNNGTLDWETIPLPTPGWQ